VEVGFLQAEDSEGRGYENYEMRGEGDEHAGEDLNELNKMKSQIRMLTVHRAAKWKKTHIRSVRKEVLFLP
jgi:hypothetical protein